MRKKNHDDELPPLYDVEVLSVERRLNVADRRAAALRKAAERRRHPGRRATDPKPAAKKSRKKR
jgi:hypothetical protein